MTFKLSFALFSTTTLKFRLMIPRSILIHNFMKHVLHNLKQSNLKTVLLNQTWLEINQSLYKCVWTLWIKSSCFFCLQKALFWKWLPCSPCQLTGNKTFSTLFCALTVLIFALQFSWNKAIVMDKSALHRLDFALIGPKALALQLLVG